MKASKRLLIILSATILSFCLNIRGAFAGKEHKSGEHNHLTDRINKVRSNLKDQVQAGDTEKLKEYNISDRLLNSWGNWGNWNNWKNWAKWNDWNNWGNWGNWGNY